MTVDAVVREFEKEKLRIRPLLKKGHYVIPLFRDRKGDGVFYNGDDQLCWKYSMSGHSTASSPDEILAAFRQYKDAAMDMQAALRLATKALRKAYRHLQGA